MINNKYNIVGFGGNYYISSAGPLSNNEQYNFFHFKSIEAAEKYINEVLKPLDVELSESPVVYTKGDF